MLLDEASEPMDFSRTSPTFNDYTRGMETKEEQERAEQKLGDPNLDMPKGLDLSVLDRLSQKAIRSGLTKIALLPSTPHLSRGGKTSRISPLAAAHRILSALLFKNL